MVVVMMILVFVDLVWQVAFGLWAHFQFTEAIHKEVFVRDFFIGVNQPMCIH